MRGQRVLPAARSPRGKGGEGLLAVAGKTRGTKGIIREALHGGLGGHTSLLGSPCGACACVREGDEGQPPALVLPGMRRERRPATPGSRASLSGGSASVSGQRAQA